MSATRRKLLIGGAGALAAAACGAAGFFALAREYGLVAKTRAGVAFGTTVALTFAGPDEQALEAALHAGFQEIRACDAAASLFRPDSALSRLNRDGALHDPDSILLELTRFALELSEASGGAFDPTVQPYWPLWYQASRDGRRPDPQALAEAARKVGWRAVEVSDVRIAYAREGVAMTLNSLLQGYAADRVLASAKELGIQNAFVDTGEFGALGAHPDGRPWRLGGAGARALGEIEVIADPFLGFASTSAGAGTPFSADASDNHIFDPATGLSPRGLASATVFAPTGLLADGLSTAALVLGADKARALAARYPAVTLRLAVG